MSGDLTAFREDLFRTCSLFSSKLLLDNPNHAKALRLLAVTAAFVNGDPHHNLSYVHDLFRRCCNDLENDIGFIERTVKAGRYSEEFAMQVWHTFGVITGTARELGIELTPDAEEFAFKITTLLEQDDDKGMDAFRSGSNLGHDLVYMGMVFSTFFPNGR